MNVSITPHTNIKAALTILVPSASPAAVHGMAVALRDYCRHSAAGESVWAMESRSQFDGMLYMVRCLGLVTEAEDRQVREYVAMLDFACARQLAGQYSY